MKSVISALQYSIFFTAEIVNLGRADPVWTVKTKRMNFFLDWVFGSCLPYAEYSSSCNTGITKSLETAMPQLEVLSYKV